MASGFRGFDIDSKSISNVQLKSPLQEFMRERIESYPNRGMGKVLLFGLNLYDQNQRYNPPS
jgi:hypothetical protein